MVICRETPKSVGVIGAGPAGLTAAYELSKRGIKVEVFEAQSAVGGLSRSLNLWGQTVDVGPHRFFSTDPRVNGIWLEVVGPSYCIVNRLTRIYYNDTFFDYPLKASDALIGLGVLEASRCIASYLLARLGRAEDSTTFEAWVVSRFGRRLFEIFFKSYSEKLWGMPCDQLDSEFAAQRIRGFSLKEAIWSAVFSHKEAKHKTLVDQFAYPLGGTGSVYESMAARISEMGGEVNLNARVHRVSSEQEFGSHRMFVHLRNGATKVFDHLISTMPITTLVERMDAPPDVLRSAACLSFRNTILVYLEVEGADLFPDQWIYIHSPHLRSGRITNFRNWTPHLFGDSPNSILCLELWCSDIEPIWNWSADRISGLAMNEIHSTKLISSRRVLNQKVIKIPKSYPVYRQGYRTELKVLERLLGQFDKLSVIGRYGAFKYNNQDHSILMGLLAALNIAERHSHDLWGVNSDYEYQEKSTITASGLQPIQSQGAGE